jgi:hypothetical protein
MSARNVRGNPAKKSPWNVAGDFIARLQRSIWKDIQWFNSLASAVKIISLIVGIGFIVGAWYLGIEWWMSPITLRYSTRPAARLEVLGVILGLILLVYVAYVLDRDRESRANNGK